jgi:hypothetical protein
METKLKESTQEIQFVKDLIQARDIAGVEAALAKANIINAEDKAGHTLLQVAAFLGNFEVVRLLISKGANVNSKDNENVTCLHKVSA